MTVNLIRETGEALYGSRWQTEIARDLGMSDRHVRRLATGEAEFTRQMAMTLCYVARARSATLDAVIDRLSAAAAG